MFVNAPSWREPSPFYTHIYSCATQANTSRHQHVGVGLRKLVEPGRHVVWWLADICGARTAVHLWK